MVVDRYADHFPCLNDLSRYLEVFAGWLRISGGMIMGYDDAGTGGDDCTTEYFPGMYQAGIEYPFSDDLKTCYSVSAIEPETDESLTYLILEKEAKVPHEVFRSGEGKDLLWQVWVRRCAVVEFPRYSADEVLHGLFPFGS